MRRIFKSFMLIAAAAMAFTSCQKEETAAPEIVSATLTMHADVEQTKTYLENNTVLWGKGEAVTLYVGAGETAKFFDSASTDAYDGQASALFTFAIEDVAKADSYSLGGIYPASAAKGINNNDNPESYKIALPATQNAEAGKYDPSAYIMVLKPEAVETLPSDYKAYFRRAVALNKITLTNVKEDISSVEIMVPEKKYLAGRRYMNLTTGESGEVYESGTQTNVVKVNGDFKSGSFDVWFCSWGVELVEGEALTVKMTSANNTYTRTITTRAEGIKFVEGDLNTLTINMEKADVEAISTITGDYLIASKTSSGWFLMTPTNGGKFYSATTSVSSSSTVTCADFYDVADVNNYVWNVAKYDNGYSIKSVNTNKYVTYSGSSNEAYANEELSDAAKMDIQLADQSAVIESMNVSGRKLQYNASSPRFAFYTTAQAGVYLIPWIPDTTPRITLAKNSDQVAFDATAYDFTYTTKNITGNVDVTIKEGATMTNVSASASNGTVTVKFEANADTEQKTATIVLSYEGAESVSVILTQAGKTEENVPVEYTVKYTVSSTIAVTTSGVAPNGSTATFKNTYTNNKEQMTKGNSQTYTLSGFNGCVIKSVTLTMKSNSSAGAGTFSLKAGTTTLASISSATTFNKWYDNTSYGSSYRPVHVTLTNDSYEIGANENVVIELAGTTNSIYCQAVEITYQTSSGNSDSGAGNEGGETPEPEEPGQGGENPSGPVVVLSEQFDNSTTSDSSTAITTSEFSNFSGTTSKAYTSKYGGIKLGSSSAVGYITSKSLDLSSTFTVQIDACKYGSDTGNIVVTVGSQTQTISNSQLGAAGTFKTFTLTFEAATTSSTVKIATSSKRAYIDNVVITRN